MSRISNFRPNFDDLIPLSLPFLKQRGLMVGWATDTLTFAEKGRILARFQITVRLGLGYFEPTSGYMKLSYSYKGESINYNIDLVQLSSNLNIEGGIWYFICPVTKSRCRTLYLHGKYFLSRHALKGILYGSQTCSKGYSLVVKEFGPTIKLDEALESLYRRYAKSHYRSKPTPKALEVMKWESKV